MFKKFNFTGKKRLLWKGDNPNIYVNIDEISQYQSDLKLLFEIKQFQQKFPEHILSAEIYQARMSKKKVLGTLKEISDDTYTIPLDDFEPSQVKLRVKISEPKTGKIVGYADRIKPVSHIVDEKEQKKQKAFQSSIFKIRNSNNLEVPYSVLIQREDRPTILCNSKISFREKLIQDSKLQFILLPSILRETLYKYFLDESLHNDKWFLALMEFCEKLTDKPGIRQDKDGQIIYDDETSEWINEVCDTFSINNKFISQLSSLFDKED